MSSTFKFHSQVQETVPWQATYEFPTQATKVNKQVVKIPAKNGGSFTSNNTIRMEFPSDGYVNMLNSYLQLDVTIAKGANTRVAFQRGGAQNLIKRLRILYGSLVIEDIQEYKTLTRILHEAAIPQDYRESFGAILDGMQSNLSIEPVASGGAPAGAIPGNVVTGGVCQAGGSTTTAILASATASAVNDAYVNNTIVITITATGAQESSVITGYVGSSKVATFSPAISFSPGTGHSYTIIAGGTVGSGIVSADQTAVDLAGAMNSGGTGSETTRTFCLNLLSGILTCKKLIPLKWMASQLAIEVVLATEADCLLYDNATAPTYSVSNPNFVTEMLEFDSTYDQAFFAGLTSGGVPLRFSSFHYHSFNLSGNSNTIQIHERARSVKSGFAVCRATDANSGLVDSDRFFHALGQTYTSGVITSGTRQSGAITQFQWRVGGRYYPSQPVRCQYGGAEALVELLKAVNYFGDYTAAAAINFYSWTSYGDGQGDKFIMACEFENVDALPGTIAGINAEEQSDIALTINSGGNATAKQCDVFMHYDSLLIVRDGNTVDLIM